MEVEETIKMLDSNNLAVPRKKSNKKWGLPGSSLLDRKTQEECLGAYLVYLKESGQL